MMKSQFWIFTIFIFALGACGEQREVELEQQLAQTKADLASTTAALEELSQQNKAKNEALNRAKQEISMLRSQESRKEPPTKSASSIAYAPHAQSKEARVTLLVDGNNVGTFSSRSACEKAANAVNHEADKEQAERMEHNRKVYAGEISPSVIYGNAIRAKTQCLDLGQ